MSEQTLPQPNNESAGLPSLELPAPEASVPTPEKNTAPASPVAPLDPTTLALPAAQSSTPAAPQQQALQPQQLQDSPLIADDVDVIEKEWVKRAKKIVENTQGDPYSQKEQLSEFKADYMKKRYNKDIKLDK